MFDDEAEYECDAKTSKSSGMLTVVGTFTDTNGSSKVSSVLLLIRPPMCLFVSAEEETRFSKNLSNVEGTETDSVKLICEVSKPGADVTWYKGDEELPEGGRYDQIVDGKRRILLIQDLKLEDAGEYNCRLSPSVKTSGNLKINGEEDRPCL